MKLFILLGSINAFIAVALGAFGAHGLEGKISERMVEVWKTGVLYHIFHALGLLFIAFLVDKFPNATSFTWAGWIMFIGILFFSGSLYALSTTGIKFFGPITPLGGLAFLIAWVLVAVGALRYL
ncbi:DUF423 domain-containing protein [Bacillus pinisoli]|uniref:DUF423 domain-containing protein n=1 Tax=Bacillus pinisoli TaxID=2901866 RepID=UPI001FF2B796|nr:DUF423 domain-containing protein [Bacillus pinisoli]